MARDKSEAQLMTAASFLDSTYSDGETRFNSRAQTPALVSAPTFPSTHPSAPSTARSQPPRFHLSKIYASMKNRQLPGHMPGEFPRDSFVESSEIEQEIARKQRPATRIAKLSRSVAKLTKSPQKESAGIQPITPISSRRPMPRASTLPQTPDITNLQVEADVSSEYAIVVSMYEVYNDRIFDLLTGTAMGPKALAKDAKRRPLLFKCTEQSPDRKVVAGLRKVICGSLEEALVVLETGLTERRVAGTGSNAVSSRSHGFFCIEVKKRDTHKQNPWTSATMSIVDLAGSERARTAKTAGATLAEAGKINESLMYLGQCMQMQSDNAHLNPANDAHLVPYRQCKLTELLFSNIFSQRSGGSAARRHSKAIMIVTADPRGDFNATSQILRYSALAREVTVPRIPSVTESIIYPSLSKHDMPLPSPTSEHRPAAALTSDAAEQIATLQSQLDILRLQLHEETERRKAAEESWTLACSKIDEAVEEAEATVRAECMDIFDKQLSMERANWANAREEERDANEKLIDEKIDILRNATEADDDEDGGIQIYEDSWQDKYEDLKKDHEGVLDRLRMAENVIERMESQKQVARTPSRKLKPLKTKRWVANDEDSLVGINDENSMPVV